MDEKILLENLGSAVRNGVALYVYRVTVGSCSWVIERRYSAFEKLDTNLRASPGITITAELPKKAIIARRQSERVIKERMTKLFAYIQGLVSDQKISQTFFLLRFLSFAPSDAQSEKQTAKHAPLELPVRRFGFLMKVGEVVKSLKTRFFVLVDHLYYFKEDDHINPIGAIFLDSNVKVAPFKEVQDYPFGISIITQKRHWQLFATSDNEANGWIAAIKGVTEGKGAVPHFQPPPSAKPSAPAAKEAELVVPEKPAVSVVTIQEPSKPASSGTASPVPDDAAQKSQAVVAVVISPEEQERRKRSKTLKHRPRYQEVDVTALPPDVRTKALETFKQVQGDTKKPIGLTTAQLQDALARSGFDLDLDTAGDIAQDLCWTLEDDAEEGNGKKEKKAKKDKKDGDAEHDEDDVSDEGEEKKEKKKKKKKGDKDAELLVSSEAFVALLAELTFAYKTANALPPLHDDDIASEEFGEMLEALGFEFTTVEVESLHDISDPRGSGSIGFEEVVQLFHFLRLHWKAFSAVIRSGHTGKVTPGTVDHRVPKGEVYKTLALAGHKLGGDEKYESEEDLVDFGEFIALAVTKRTEARKLRAESKGPQPKARKGLGTSPKDAFMTVYGAAVEAMKKKPKEDEPPVIGASDLGGCFQRMGPVFAGLPVSVLADIQLAADPKNTDQIGLQAFVSVGTLLARAHDKWMDLLKKNTASAGTLDMLKTVMADLQVPSDAEEDSEDEKEEASSVVDLKFALEDPTVERLSSMFADAQNLEFHDVARCFVFLAALVNLFHEWAGKDKSVSLAKFFEGVRAIVRRGITQKETMAVAKTLPGLEGMGSDVLDLPLFSALALEMRYRGSGTLPGMIEFGPVLPPHVIVSSFAFSPPPTTSPQFHMTQPVLAVAEYVADPEHEEYGVTTLRMYDAQKGLAVKPQCPHRESNGGCACQREAPKIQGEVRAIVFAPDGTLFATVTFVTTRHGAPPTPPEQPATGWREGYEWDQGIISVQVWNTVTCQSLLVVGHFAANNLLRGELRRARNLVDFAWPRADIDWDKIAVERGRRPANRQDQLQELSASVDASDRSRCRIMALVAGPRVVEIWDVLRGTLVSVLRAVGHKNLRKNESYDHDALGVLGFMEARFIPDSTAIIHLESKAYSKPCIAVSDVQTGIVRVFDYLSGEEQEVIKHASTTVTSGKTGSVFGGIGIDAKLKMWNSETLKRTKKLGTPVGSNTKLPLRTAPGLDSTVIAFERLLQREVVVAGPITEDLVGHALRLPVLAHNPSPAAAQIAVCLPDNSVVLWNYEKERKDETTSVAMVLSNFAGKEAERARKAAEKAVAAAGTAGKEPAVPKVTVDVPSLRVLAKELVPAMEAQQAQTVVPLTPYAHRTVEARLHKDGAEYVQFSATGECVLVQGIPQDGCTVRVHSAQHGAVLYAHRTQTFSFSGGAGSSRWPACWPLAQFSPDSRYVAHVETSQGYMGGRVVGHKLPDPETDSQALVHPAVPFDLLMKQHQIILAIFDDSKSKLSNLVKQDLVSLNFVSPVYGASPLMLAVILDKPSLVKKLIQLGADPSYGRAAVSPASPDVLLNSGMHDHLAPVHVALLFRRAKVLKKLLESGADLNGIWRVQDDINAGLAPLHLALICEDLAMVDQLINDSEGVDLEAIDWKGRTPLHIAVLRGNAGAVKSLLDCGADRTATTADGQKLTALHMAVEKGDEDMIKALTTLDDGKKKKKLKKSAEAAAEELRVKRVAAIKTMIQAKDSKGKRVMDLNEALVKKCVDASLLG